jgi:hypothetical protein
VIVVYTCILNDWDYARNESAIDPKTRYIMYADRPIEPCLPWEIQPAYTPCGMPASRASRLPKILPHLHFQADYSIWHDANFVLRADPQTLIAAYLKDADIAMFAHPCRNTVAQEVEVLLKEKIGVREEVLAQQTAWLHMGAPCGLWAGGLIIRRHTHAVQQFNEAWWHFFKHGSTRDQLALPMAAHSTGMKIETIPGHIYESPLMGFHWHAAWRDKNQEFHTQEAEYQMRRKRLEELAR